MCIAGGCYSILAFCPYATKLAYVSDPVAVRHPQGLTAIRLPKACATVSFQALRVVL